MARILREIESGDQERSPIYLRFSTHVVDHTETYANGEVNADIDPYNEVVGIEMLSTGPEQLKTLADLSKRYDLDMTPLFKAGRR